MSTSTPGTRPTSITVVCILGFLGAAVTVPLLFAPTTRALAAWYPPYLGATAVVGFACMIGLWKMKRWAVMVYVAMTLANQVILLATGLWNPLALIVPAIVAAIGIMNLKRMT